MVKTKRVAFASDPLQNSRPESSASKNPTGKEVLRGEGRGLIGGAGGVWVSGLTLVGAGVAVFPCGDDKRPLTKRGFKDATVDPDIVHEWWSHWPDALIGVPTGKFV